MIIACPALCISKPGKVEWTRMKKWKASTMSTSKMHGNGKTVSKFVVLIGVELD